MAAFFFNTEEHLLIPKNSFTWKTFLHTFTAVKLHPHCYVFIPSDWMKSDITCSD